MVTKNVPRRLWDYGIKWEAEIMSRTAHGRDGRTGYERITGDTPDISEWLDFEFYDLVWFWDKPGDETNPCIGRFLGVAHRIGTKLCYWVLKSSGHVIARTTVQHITREDLAVQETMDRVTAYNKDITDRLDDTKFVDGFIPLDDIFDDDADQPMEPAEGEVAPGIEADDYDEDSYDTLINAELLLPKGDKFVRGQVTKRARANDGRPLGRCHPNPILNTREYEVELSDGTVEEYTANVIAENLFSQCDTEGNHFYFMKEIVDHRSNKNA